MATMSLPDTPDGPSTCAPEKRPPSPARPPVITTSLPKVRLRPSTRPLPLMSAPCPSTITWRSSAEASLRPRRSPTPNESAMPSIGSLATRKAGLSNRMAVSTTVPSLTPSPEISPAVEHPTSCAAGTVCCNKATSRPCMASRLPNTSTNCASKPVSADTLAGVSVCVFTTHCRICMDVSCGARGDDMAGIGLTRA